MEHWEHLCPGGLQFVWDDTLFPPGTDTFLLSSFPKLKPHLRVCDLGCGTGLLGLLLLQRQPQLHVTGVELQEQSAQLAIRAAEANQLSDQLQILQEDLRNVKRHIPSGSFDLVICNPPYYPPTSGKTAKDSSIRLARSEESCTLDELCQSAAYLLRWGGSFCLVHKPERLADVLCALRNNAIEAKRLRFVCRDFASPPSLVLVEGRRGGKAGVMINAPLILQNNNGSPSKELDAIYFRYQEDMP